LPDSNPQQEQIQLRYRQGTSGPSGKEWVYEYTLTWFQNIMGLMLRIND